MGRQSRLKRERRGMPLPSFHRPLETRWGTHPLPVRHRIGGRRGQATVTASVTFAAWMPLLNREADLGLAGILVAWALLTVVYGLVFAKLFDALD